MSQSEAAGHSMERLGAARAYAVVNRVTEVHRPYETIGMDDGQSVS